MSNKLFYSLYIKPIWAYAQHYFCTTASSERTPERKCDVAVIGGGIIGTSIARKLKIDHNNLQITLVEKERSLGNHQSSHNSGVMHCGVYYKPESLKAKLCVEGIDLLQAYCDEKKINYKKCGKLIVAAECSEICVLEELLRRGTKNGVKGITFLKNPTDIMAIASGCRGVQAIWCPGTTNVNFKQITVCFGDDFKNLGGTILFNTKIIDIFPSEDCNYPLCIVPEDEGPIQAKYAITCGGLQSEFLSKLLDNLPNQKFISLKVDYHQIKSNYCDGVQTNIYPVPDLELPFLGAHFSPKLDDTILLGPYAMPALKPEGYCNDEISIGYLSKMLTSCGFRNMILRNFSKCVNQASKAMCSESQIKDLQKIVPNFSYQCVEKGPTAVQCQLLNNDGSFVDDFVFDFFKGKGIGERIINIKFSPSPAATSCLAIADHVAREFNQKVGKT